MSDRPQTGDGGEANPASPANPALRFSRHLGRYAPLYAFATAWALMLMLFPTINHSGGGEDVAAFGPGNGQTGETVGGGDAGSAVGPGGSADTGAGGGAPGTAGGAGGGGGGQATGGGTVAAAGGGGGPVGAVATGSGVTKTGVECTPGVRQIPHSDYAVPCVAKFEGDNGGATYRGVTGDTVTFVLRKFSDASGPNGQTQDRTYQELGRPNRLTAWELFKTYAEYLNQNMELYGRKVVFQEYDAQGSYTDEAQSKGQERACADATHISKTMKAFGVLGYHPLIVETQPMAECAKQNELFVPIGASYFPESWYQRWHPFVWHYAMECERIGRDIGEYVGKRLWGKKAKWAGDPVYQQQNRVLGVYVPDNDGYQRCIDISAGALKQHGASYKHRYNYALDVSRFPDSAAQAAVQFKAAGVTTLVKAMDAVSSIFLTNAADAQRWYPEWMIIGVATQDQDASARSWNQEEVDGHLFGMSQLGAEERMNAEDGEAYKAFKAVRPDAEPPPGFGFYYYAALHMFNLLQAAGPILTPENVAAGVQKLPPAGTGSGAFGLWSFANGHTAIQDSREIYYDGSATGYDGGTGAYIETYGGKRFSSGQWPDEEPPIYPKG